MYQVQGAAAAAQGTPRKRGPPLAHAAAPRSRAALRLPAVFGGRHAVAP